MVQGDIAAKAMYKILVNMYLGDMRINEVNLVGTSALFKYAEAKPACRSWAIANGGDIPKLSRPFYCVGALQNLDDYGSLFNQQTDLLRAYGGQPPRGTFDSQTLDSLGRRGNQAFSGWLNLSGGCRT